MNELQEIVLDLWKPNSVRSRYQTFKPIFARFEGVHNEQEFNDPVSYTHLTLPTIVGV